MIAYHIDQFDECSAIHLQEFPVGYEKRRLAMSLLNDTNLVLLFRRVTLSVERLRRANDRLRRNGESLTEGTYIVYGSTCRDTFPPDLYYDLRRWAASEGDYSVRLFEGDIVLIPVKI